MDLGEKVRQRREELGMTQEELSLKMGYKSRASINKIENGRQVSPKIIVRLAEELKVSAAYLMGYEEEKKPTTTSELSENKKKIMEFVKTVPDDKVDYVIRIMQSILQDDKWFSLFVLL